MTGVTPLQAAKAIVEAVGGVIESYPNGDVHCRMRDLISIPDYGTATVDQYFTDADWVSVNAVDAPTKGFNRVTISNDTAVVSGISDRLEVIDDPVDASRKTIRAWSPRLLSLLMARRH